MDASTLKKRRMQNSCDTCKRRKVRCDSGTMPNNICSGCLNAGVECTHNKMKRKRGPKPAPKSTTENSFESAETLVSRILAEPETYPIPGDPDTIRALLVDISRYAYSLSKQNSHRSSRSDPVVVQAIPASLEPSPTPPLADSPFTADPVVEPDENTNEDIDANTISENLQKLSLQSHDQPRHFGMSSNYVLVQTLLDFKQEATGRTQEIHAEAVKRPEFWNIFPWQRDIQLLHAGPPLVFPDDDLLCDLIEIYFTHFEPYMPLLYRSSFEQSIAEGLHYIDIGFGQVVLAVCALASRCSDDRRNMPEGTDSEHAMGWRWYRQISVKPSSFIEAPRLYDLQLCVLMITYLQASSISESSWVLLGVGMRLAQAIGIHRKRPGQPRTIERELWIRAFWSIVTFDTYASMFLGRPRVTTMDDFDVEYPADCDPEFWINPECPEKSFIQPPEIPSKAAFWLHFIKLLEIAGLVHGLIYPIRKSEHWRRLGVQGKSWNQKAVIELDSALNKWASAVPDQVKWDPNRANLIFFHQSVMLYTSYYWVQIQVHKPWIPRPDQDRILSGFPSLAICANASRTIIHVAETQRKRQTLEYPIPIPLPSVFVSAIMLLINYWRGKRLNSSLDARKEMCDVYRCFGILRPYERRFQAAGRMNDVLKGIISIGQLNTHPTSPPLANPAHNWITNSSISISNELAGYPSSSSSQIKNIESDTGNSPDHQYSNNHRRIDDSAPQIDPSPSSHLPFYTNELGTLPLYSSELDTSPPAQANNIPARSDWSSAFNVYTLTDLSAPQIAFDPRDSIPEFYSSTSNQLQHVVDETSNSAAWGLSPDDNNSRDGPGDWNLFLHNVDELFQSASVDFRMHVDEATKQN